jgi:phosphatidylserine/phosphatidylglycerophosphate/cardiolipin synthase-like enzyme
MDIDHTRSFGLITRNPKLVQEAGKLFDADTKRQVYTPGHDKFVVSPENARKELAEFLRGAKKELLIYDPKVSDGAMLRVLEERKNAGVEIRVIGRVSSGRLPSRELVRLRLHTRTIIRDRKQAFMGSQSLRQLELDARREIGVIFRDAAIIKSLVRVFEEDWVASKPVATRKGVNLPVQKTAKKLAKLVGKNLPITPVVKQVAKVIRKRAGLELGPKEVEEAVESAVKEAVKDTIKDATKQAMNAAVDGVAELDRVDVE